MNGAFQMKYFIQMVLILMFDFETFDAWRSCLYFDTMGGTNMKEGYTMDKQKKNARQQLWDKENTFRISVKLQKTTDADIIAFLDGKQKQTVIKEALRRMIQEG